MFERYTEKARRVIFFARYEASNFGSAYIEAEHFLLGILREDRALFRRLLPGPSEPQLLEEEIRDICQKNSPTSTSVDLPVSEDMRRALACAAEFADELRHKQINTAHLVLGVLRTESAAASLLGNHHVTADRVRKELAFRSLDPEAAERRSTMAVATLKSQFAQLAARLKPEVEPATVFLFEPESEA